MVTEEKVKGRVVGFRDLEIDLSSGAATRGGRSLPLTRTERLLLRHLAANAGRPVTSTDVITSVWGAGYGDARHLRVWVSRLRGKVEAGGSALIKTLQGYGYLLDTGEI